MYSVKGCVIMSIRINSIRTAVEKFTGFYTKKGCIETATNIGKELVDLQKSGKVITAQEIIDVIKQKAPHIKLPNIASNRDEFISLMQKNGANELNIAYILSEIENKNYAGVFNPDLKGMFFIFDKETSGIPHISSHEMEHFMEYYCNPQTIIKRFFSFSKNIRRYLNDKRVKKELEYAIDKDSYINSQLSRMQRNPLNIQQILIDPFAADTRKYAHWSSKVVEGYEPTKKGLNEFLKSPIYSGLTSDKRIDAYIRAILRHYFHPLKTNPKFLKNLKECYEKEATAYQVTDNITRYSAGVEGITTGKIRSEVFKRAAKILDNEIKRASFKGNKKLAHQTGLPTIAVVPNEIVNEVPTRFYKWT